MRIPASVIALSLCALTACQNSGKGNTGVSPEPASSTPVASYRIRKILRSTFQSWCEGIQGLLRPKGEDLSPADEELLHGFVLGKIASALPLHQPSAGGWTLLLNDFESRECGDQPPDEASFDSLANHLLKIDFLISEQE